MAALDREVFASLQFLLKAPSKNVVRQLCRECFSSSGIISEKLTESTCSNLSVTPNEANQLIQSLHNLTRHIIYHGLTSQEEIFCLFPDGFHQNLKNLVTKIILENISAWRNEAQASQISLPRLVDMDWRVDIKTSSDNISKMAIPTCLLQLKVLIPDMMSLEIAVYSIFPIPYERMPSQLFKKMLACVGITLQLLH
ncbi:COMM domain-containing protein 9 isoform 2-T2 [Vipera latastei]